MRAGPPRRRGPGPRGRAGRRRCAGAIDGAWGATVGARARGGGRLGPRRTLRRRRRRRGGEGGGRGAGWGMVLHMVGLGLGDERDVTLRGLEAIRGAARVVLEQYTSVLPGVEPARLEALYGKPVEIADRQAVEEGSDGFLEAARDTDVAFLVVGDPFGATTHVDLQLRARRMGVRVEVIHNASIMNAVGACGLQLYRFGEAISIVFFTETWRPDSFYDKILANRRAGLHTLCLLDIRVKELTVKALCTGRKEYEPPRYMSVNVALEQLLEVEAARGEGAFDEGTMCVGVARLGTPGQSILYGSMAELQGADFGEPLHSLVIPGEVTEFEQEVMDTYRYVPTHSGEENAAAGAESPA